jgi:response regulator of citrate/malate metabolism
LNKNLLETNLIADIEDYMNKYQFQFLKNDGNEAEYNKASREKDIEELDRLKEDDSIAFNSKAEKMFGGILCNLIKEFSNRVYKKQAIDEIAFRLNVSPVTAKRYLDKHTTKQAKFEIKDKLVRC